MFLNALNKQYDRVRQIARLKLYGRAVACDTFSDNTFSLVLRIFLGNNKVRVMVIRIYIISA